MNKYEMMSPKERQKLGIVRGKVSGKLYPKKDIKKYENLETKKRKRPQIVDSKTKFKDGGDVKIKPKPKRRPTTQETIESANRINRQVRAEEKYGKAMSPADIDKAEKKMKNDNFIMKAEKARRIRAKNKVKPMGKKHGGIMNSRAIAKKYFKGGMA